ncbi:DUF624 domain-containing protein [Oceanobacillus caeni]|uniref:YesL family protein n=1 Tax=Oceanobacillus caeni TaxID=405946 RepID=UPI001C23426D|nr:DUF624 domain-containing protein [Oceanobacillus caeni]MBU8791417.1 DUF624 domain-containing protein [Oceanobacillus caeni]MCR1833779.1 DUF624 domain-containing protein [Oceanobacillus caeni]
MNSTYSAIYTILEWITKFAYVNLLWILFTLVGGVIFGFYPSTIAMFAIVRDWLRGNPDLPVFKTFWKYFKRDFIKSNILGILLDLIIILIGLDLFYIKSNNNDLLSFTYIPLFAFMLIFLLFIFYLFPAFVHFQLKIPKLIKNSFLIMLISPLYTFLIVICLVSVYFIMRAIPALFFIFGGTTFAFFTTWLCLYAFDRIQAKQNN